MGCSDVPNNELRRENKQDLNEELRPHNSATMATPTLLDVWSQQQHQNKPSKEVRQI